MTKTPVRSGKGHCGQQVKIGEREIGLEKKKKKILDEKKKM